MRPDYPPLTAWSDHSRMSMAEFAELFPVIAEDDELDPDDEVILIRGDITLTEAQLESIEEQAREQALHVAVDGNVFVDGRAGVLLLVTGDVICASMWIGRAAWTSYSVMGRVRAADCVFLQAEDEGHIWDVPSCRIDTRYLFAWNMEVATLDLCPEAVVFFIGMDANNRSGRDQVFVGTEIVHVLGSRLVARFSCELTEEWVWHSSDITDVLRSGGSILREGVDLAFVPVMTMADQALGQGDYPAAYHWYALAALAAPAYFPALYGMGEALFLAGAYAQALGRFMLASAHFPLKQTGLVNAALNYAAICALRLDLPALAHTLADASINFSERSHWHDAPLGQAYRLRAESRIRTGQLAGAQRDLLTSLELEKDHPNAWWLQGLLAFLDGDAEAARSLHAKAALRKPVLASFYDVATDTNFTAPPALKVAWDKGSKQDQ